MPVGPAKGDRGSDRDINWQLENLPELVLDGLVPDGHHTSVAHRSGREQQVLARGVDRRTFGEATLAAMLEAGDHDHRCLVDVVDEVLHRCSRSPLG